MKPNQPITLKDIAKRLGITVATVSRALKNYPDISSQTKEAVLKLVKELNYRPNPIALNLRKNRTQTIGVIIPEVIHHFFSTVVSGIVEVADEVGYSVMLCQSNELYAKEVREAGVLLNGRVDGLLISLANETRTFEHLQEFIDFGIPIVMFDKVCDELHASKVVVDDFEGAFQAVEHLIQQGCRNIAHIKGKEGPSNVNERLRGYKVALETYQIPFQPHLVFETSQMTFEGGMLIGQEILELPEVPDGIFSAVDLIGIGAMTVLRRNGVKIPEQTCFINFTDWEMALAVEPPMSSVYQPGIEMGRMAAEMLIREIELTQKKQEFQHTTEVLKTHLIIRESSRRKNEKS